jgi:hypothetical protein
MKPVCVGLGVLDTFAGGEKIMHISGKCTQENCIFYILHFVQFIQYVF